MNNSLIHLCGVNNDGDKSSVAFCDGGETHVDPQLSTEISEVTCEMCLKKLMILLRDKDKVKTSLELRGFHGIKSVSLIGSNFQLRDNTGAYKYDFNKPIQGKFASPGLIKAKEKAERFLVATEDMLEDLVMVSESPDGIVINFDDKE